MSPPRRSTSLLQYKPKAEKNLIKLPKSRRETQEYD